MSYSSWDQDPDRLRTSAGNIAQIEAQIRAIPPDQRSYYQLQQRGITIPPGYRLEKDGKLKYVAVDNSQHWYNKPEVMIPLIATAGLTYGATSGFGTLGAGADAIPTIGSRALTNGMGYGPASLAGTSSIPTAAQIAAEATIPTIASRSLTNGMGTDPASLMGTGAVPGALNAANPNTPNVNTPSNPTAPKTGTNSLDDIPDWLKAVIGSLSGLPALMAKQGPSDEEKAYADQARRLLAQQEQRTQFQNPLYSYITKSVYGLQPGTNGAQYPYNSLDDVKIPGMS